MVTVRQVGTEPAEGAPRRRTRPRSPKILVSLLVVLLTLPFIFQAFHIDDRIYLEVAGNVLSNPLHPYDYPPVFEGLVTPDAASHSHLPLTSYYLALLRRLAGGEPEWLFHLAFLVFPLLAVWSFADLARRFTAFPAAAACLLIAGPGVLVLSHTLMTEVPLLAFWALSVSRVVAICDGETAKSNWIAAGAGLTGAALISLISVGLIVLLGAHLALSWNAIDASARRKLPLLLLLPLLVWAAWYWCSYLHYDRFVLVRTVLHLDKRSAFSWLVLGQKLLSLLLNLGGAFLCPIVLWYGFGRRRSLWLIPVVVLTIGLGPWAAPDSWSRSQSFLWVLLAGTGTLAFIGVLREGADGNGVDSPPETASGRRLRRLLLFWLAGIATAAVVLYPSGSVRYVLLLAPPLILLWLRALERKVDFNRYFLRNLVWTGVILTLLWSLPIAYADYRFAGMYREEARALVQDYRRPGQEVWFTAEWGFRYYLEKAGARLLPRTSLGPKPGDVIIKPRVAFPWVTLYDRPEYTRLREQRPTSMTFPIRLLDFESHAGFYSTAWGILPYSWASEGRWEWYNVYEVIQEYDGPIPEPERHW